MRAEDLSGDARRLIDALVSARVAWQNDGSLAHATGLTVDAAAELLADLDAAGWVEPWADPPVGPSPWPCPVVTLTPIAAALLGVHLVERGPAEIPMWARDGEDDPAPPKARGIFRRCECLALVPDPAPGPEALAIAAEEAAAVPPPAPRRSRKERPHGAWNEARAEAARAKRKARRRARSA